MLLAVEGWWIGDLYAFLSETPATLCVDCLEASQVLLLEKEKLEALYHAVPQLERFFRLLLQRAFLSAQRRSMDLIRKQAAERYADFLQQYPQIEQRVSDRQIASYLGITPESLSRLRRRRTRS